jgi:hypothetical protein
MIQWNNYQGNNETLSEVYHKTNILRRPISGIISGYHQLPYILIAPSDNNPSHTIEINGKINVSPRFILSPQTVRETFGEIFDPDTFNREIQGRVFSFAYLANKPVKLENEYFKLQNFEEKPEEHLNRVHESLLMQENTRTGLIFGPKFQYYPVSVDRFIAEIVEREFRV